LVWLAAPGLILTSACSTVTPEGQPVDLAFAYQVNLELIDLLGPFYHRRQQFPEVRAVTDVAAVKLDRALETPEQEPTDFNLFVLDGRTGTLLFSRGTKTLAAVSDPSLKAARALAVTRQGRLAVIDAQGRVDTCWSFDGSATTRAASCQASAVEARDVAAWSDGSVFVLTAGGGLVALDPVSGTTASVRLRPQTPATAVGLRADGHHLLLVHDGGYALSAFAERGCAGGGHGSGAPAGPPFVFTRVAKARDIPALFDYGPGPGPAPAPPAPPQRLQFRALARTLRGDYYALADDRLLRLDRHLRPIEPFFFESLPIPFRRLAGVDGLDYTPAADLLHVFDPRALNAYLLDPDGKPESDPLTRHLPAELLPVLDAALDVDPLAFEPARDVFTYPAVAAALRQAFDDLVRE
jgi:hypothetical protein